MLDNVLNIHLVTFSGGVGYQRSARRLIKQAKKHKYFASLLSINESNLEELLPETKNNILLVNKVANMEKDISDLESSLKGYVTYDRFSLIERVVVSTIALVLITVGASLLRLIITK